MTKITAEHLVRNAIVYVRQSTTFQVVQNLESQRRQYGLTERARQLGWSDVEVIDDDLGRRRQSSAEFTACCLVANAAVEAGPQHMKFGLAHGALEPEQEPIIEEGWMIDAICIAD